MIESAGRIGGPRAVASPTLAYLAPAAGALVALAAGVEARTVLVAVAASAIVCALVRAVVEHLRIEAARERADRWIGMRAGQPPPDELLLARMAELESPRLRADLARSFRRIAADAMSRGRALTPAQHNRRALRSHVDELARVADRLADPAQPVTPRGVALAHRLVTAGGGPLYNSRRAEELPASLNSAAAALDPLGQ
jgi:hypothetical protein